MPRVKHSVRTRARKKKVLKRAKGQYGGRRRMYRRAKESTARSLRYAYRDRRVKKREFRILWIARINAACRELDMTYSQLVYGLKKANVVIDRKILADVAVNDSKTFKKIASLAKQ